mmetsp:Transcript_26002/g.72825  ORF Transcript_26002/g.72825 Transcript_26002/m.72825 type:complete len:222 (-) Transcript_26002:667-1332(-)
MVAPQCSDVVRESLHYVWMAHAGGDGSLHHGSGLQLVIGANAVCGVLDHLVRHRHSLPQPLEHLAKGSHSNDALDLDLLVGLEHILCRPCHAVLCQLLHDHVEGLGCGLPRAPGRMQRCLMGAVHPSGDGREGAASVRWVADGDELDRLLAPLQLECAKVFHHDVPFFRAGLAQLKFSQLAAIGLCHRLVAIHQHLARAGNHQSGRTDLAELPVVIRLADA